MEVMTDQELIRYCRTHCTTPRALFSREQVQRMAELAGWEIPKTLPEWVSMHEDMDALCDAAQTKLDQVGGSHG